MQMDYVRRNSRDLIPRQRVRIRELYPYAWRVWRDSTFVNPIKWIAVYDVLANEALLSIRLRICWNKASVTVAVV